MITSDDILSLNFYNYGNPFTGSYQGMRYRIIKQKEKKDEEGTILKEEGLLATIWPEPFAYEKTADDLKTTQLFPFSEEGRIQVVGWLNTSWEKGEWRVLQRLSLRCWHKKQSQTMKRHKYDTKIKGRGMKL